MLILKSLKNNNTVIFHISVEYSILSNIQVDHKNISFDEQLIVITKPHCILDHENENIFDLIYLKQLFLGRFNGMSNINS